MARGKILPADRFVKLWAGGSLRLPESIFVQTVTGDYPEEDPTSVEDIDVRLYPDAGSLRLLPWYDDAPTAQAICDCHYADAAPVPLAPRQVLKRVLALYDDHGWKPVVAPELEFYIVARNTDPDYPLTAPTGRSGRPETGRQAYGVDAVNEFDAIVGDIYGFCDDQDIDIDTIAHESGAGQMEMNFNHGDPLTLADQTFLFKRTVREAALRHGVYATFMAKPMENEPGSALHLHQSVVDAHTGRNLFSDAGGEDSTLFHAYIAGLQTYLPAAMPLLAPNVNSYRRLAPDWSAPVNLEWARDNRTVGLRAPLSSGANRRIENRVAGADANPYLAIAASLACGYLGMVEGLTPSPAITGSGYRKPHQLPRHMPEALALLARSEPLRQVLGDAFVDCVVAVKQAEWEAYFRVVSSWEREHLLLNV